MLDKIPTDSQAAQESQRRKIEKRGQRGTERKHILEGGGGLGNEGSV